MHFLHCRQSICQAAEVVCIYTLAADTTGWQAGIHPGMLVTLLAGSIFSPARKLEQGWSSRQGCKNLSPALSKRFPRRRFHHKHIGKALAHMMRPRVGSEAVAELCWVLRHGSWIWDSLVRQPTSKRPRQMQTRARCRLGTKESLLPSVLHSCEIVDMFLKKILQNLIPGRIVSVSQMC